MLPLRRMSAVCSVPVLSELLAIALLVPIVIIAVAIALIWLGISRHRRAQRKHAGLRVLR